MIRIILATSNRGKQIEIEAFLNSSNEKEKQKFEVLAYSDLIEPFEIEETGKTFKENAIIKAEAVFEELRKKFPSDNKLIVIADDSGISIEALNNEPNIFSARYSGANATDKSNVQKVIDNLNKINTAESQAFYTSAIAIVSVALLKLDETASVALSRRISKALLKKDTKYPLNSFNWVNNNLSKS